MSYWKGALFWKRGQDGAEANTPPVCSPKCKTGALALADQYQAHLCRSVQRIISSDAQARHLCMTANRGRAI